MDLYSYKIPRYQLEQPNVPCVLNGPDGHNLYGERRVTHNIVIYGKGIILDTVGVKEVNSLPYNGCRGPKGSKGPRWLRDEEYRNTINEIVAGTHITEMQIHLRPLLHTTNDNLITNINGSIELEIYLIYKNDFYKVLLEEK